MTVTAHRPAPSVVPPTPAKESRKRRSPLWARLSATAGAVLLIASGGGIVGGKMLISKTTETIEVQDLTGDAKKTVEEGGGATIEGPIDLLLMGVDKRASWSDDTLHADTIIILHIPATHDQAFLISVPRDTEVETPAFAKSKWEGGTVKATEAFYWGAQNGAGAAGGAQLLAKTLKNMTGISFDGFKGVIDELGGVDMCVDQQVTSRHLGLIDGKPVYLTDAKKDGLSPEPVVHKVGCREMEGWAALDYARQRYGLKNGDYDRQRHQQQLLKAMAKKASDGGVMTNPLKISSLIKSAGSAFTLDLGDIELADFALGMKDVAANDMVLLRTNSGTFSSNGSGREQFREISLEMFEAAKKDQLAQFVLDHPEVVANEK
jgi:LCP family protein required for cell wall assembly